MLPPVHMLFESSWRAMVVEVSHDDVLITEVKKKVKVWREIERTGADKGYVEVLSLIM